MRPNRLVAALLALLLAATSGCRGSTDPDPLEGTWLASTFQVAYAGQGQKDVLAAGGTFGVNVASNFVTAGTVIIPATITGTVPFSASLAGAAVKTGNTVQFAANADSFARSLVFTLVENRLEAVNQVVAGTNYNIILTRQ